MWEEEGEEEERGPGAGMARKRKSVRKAAMLQAGERGRGATRW